MGSVKLCVSNYCIKQQNCSAPWASDVSALHDAKSGAPCSCLDFAEESVCACAACLKLSVPVLLFPC